MLVYQRVPPCFAASPSPRTSFFTRLHGFFASHVASSVAETVAVHLWFAPAKFNTCNVPGVPCIYPLVICYIAIENGPFIVDFPIKHGEFSIAMLV